MKRFIALFLIFAAVFSLSACGGKAEEKASRTSGQKDFTVLEVNAANRFCDIEITAMKTEKDTYKVGEEIILTLTWTGTPASDTWVGIIPAATPHGDEYVNDEADLDYIYLQDHDQGAFVFTVELEPGEYTLRVNETDDGGAELAWCAFAVSG